MMFALLTTLGLIAACNPPMPTMPPALAPSAESRGASADSIQLVALGAHATHWFNTSASEIACYHAPSATVFVLNVAEGVEMISIKDPGHPESKGVVRQQGLTSVACFGDLIAYSSLARATDGAATVHFMKPDGTRLGEVTVGIGADMICFTPDGKHILAACEAEPSDDGTIDPKGTVSIVDLASDPAQSTVRTVGFERFDAAMDSLRAAGGHLVVPHASVSQQLEPEYIAVARDGATAYVTLQEANAIAVVDIAKAECTAVLPLGFKDFSQPGMGLDPSDKDGGAHIASWPVLGMYQPDTVACVERNGTRYLLTANEGEMRETTAFNEVARFGEYKPDDRKAPGDAPAYDAKAFPLRGADGTMYPLEMLRGKKALGRLEISVPESDVDGDGDLDRIVAFGGRSFSVWKVDGDAAHASISRVFDSGDAFERIIAERMPEAFNADNAKSPSADSRSSKKGPEPEGLAVGNAFGHELAFIGLERAGGVMVYDIGDPTKPVFVTYANRRDPSVDLKGADKADFDPATLDRAGDLGPEGLCFIDAAHSPNGEPLLIACNEVSGTTTVFAVRARHAATANGDSGATSTRAH